MRSTIEEKDFEERLRGVEEALRIGLDEIGLVFMTSPLFMRIKFTGIDWGGVMGLLQGHRGTVVEWWLGRA